MTVTWIENGKKIEWTPLRTPALGWNELTLVEALLDSAVILLAKNELQRGKARVAQALTIVRAQIEREKKEQPILLDRCRFRETLRTRCNRTPLFKENLCEYHYRLTH